MAQPHLADSAAAATLRAESVHWPSRILSPAEVCDLELQMMGLLDGGPSFTLPCGAIETRAGERLALRNPEGLMLAAFDVASVSPTGIHGRLEGLQLSVYHDFKPLRALPEGLDRETVVVFTDTHHPAFRPTFEALAKIGTPLLLVVPAGSADPADNRHFARVRCVRAALSAFATPPDLLLLPLVPGTRAPSRETIARNLGAACAFDGPPSPPEQRIPRDALIPEALAAFTQAFPPNALRGFTVFLTGLSGSGKSTVARILEARLLEAGGRQVTLLDGDLVRQKLSSELGFSREHRNLNILRIGYVASEITKNGGIAICAPIAPYESIRREVRATIEPHGGFLLVHVATPLEVCEQRDVKGLYAKARAGIVKEFTGISDPYDIPADAALTLDTTTRSAEACAGTILARLTADGYLS